jgi:dipeptidyl aminopeptidase/acylaminoacyl peptidase
LEADAPWRQRFRSPEIWWARVARTAPTRGLVVARLSGAPQLHAWDVPTGTLRPLTHRPDGVLDGRIAPDGRYVYYLADRQGDEIGHLVRVPFEGGEPEDLTPELPPYANWGCSISRKGNLVAFSVATRGRHQLYGLSLGPGDTVGVPRTFHQSRYELWLPAVCSDGTLVVVPSMKRARKRQPSLLAFEVATGRQVAELWDGPGTSALPMLFASGTGDRRLLASTNRSGVHRPLIWNVRTGERVDLPLGQLDGEVYALDWAADRQWLLLSQFHRAVQQLYIYHLGDDTLRPLAHPSGTFRAAYLSSRQGEIIATWQDATHPGCLIALDATTGRQTRTVLAAGASPPCRPWRSITFASSDGQAIQGWLAVPEGSGPSPAILKVHGGPQSVERDTFDAGCQAWLDHGFAYCTINYRGSTTFGRSFEEQIWGHPGDWEMEDIVAARAWLVEQGIARPDQILLTGRSYGGFLTLLALGKRPDLWAGGMAHVAIGDFTLTYEDASESLKAWNVAMFGGTPQEQPEQYRASSPITYAEHVRAPVLLIQGRHDTRTPARQAQAYIDKMQALGKSIEVHWFDAGHMRADTDRDLDHMERMLRFAARICGGSSPGR